MKIPAPLSLALRLAVSAALVAWILHRTPFQEVGAAFRSADLRFVLLALVLQLLDTLVSVRRWRLLIRARGGEAPFAGLARAYFVGIFFNNLLPSTIGGDTVRVVHTARSGVGRARALGIIFADRFLGLLALLLFAIAGALAAGRLPWALAGAAVLGLAAVLLFLHRKLHWTWEVLARASGWSLLLQTSVVIGGWCLAHALHAPIPLPYFFLIVPLALIVMMLPVSINAIGVRENAWAFFFAAFGAPAALGVAVAWLSYGLVLAQALIGGAIYASGRLASSRLREGVAV